MKTLPLILHFDCYHLLLKFKLISFCPYISSSRGYRLSNLVLPRHIIGRASVHLKKGGIEKEREKNPAPGSKGLFSRWMCCSTSGQKIALCGAVLLCSSCSVGCGIGRPSPMLCHEMPLVFFSLVFLAICNRTVMCFKWVGKEPCVPPLDHERKGEI